MDLSFEGEYEYVKNIANVTHKINIIISKLHELDYNDKRIIINNITEHINTINKNLINALLKSSSVSTPVYSPNTQESPFSPNAQDSQNAQNSPHTHVYGKYVIKETNLFYSTEPESEYSSDYNDTEETSKTITSNDIKHTNSEKNNENNENNERNENNENDENNENNENNDNNENKISKLSSSDLELYNGMAYVEYNDSDNPITVYKKACHNVQLTIQETINTYNTKHNK